MLRRGMESSFNFMGLGGLVGGEGGGGGNNRNLA
jgi:hypothetical protein